MEDCQTINLPVILEKTGKYGIDCQAPVSGAMPPGHNGPYNDPETPVRNTAHWLFLFADLYEKTGENKWKNAGEKAAEFLMSEDARPAGKSFHCRDKAGKDQCNGLIGQAWVIEALVKAAETFSRCDCYELAEEVFMMHPWDDNVGIWHRVEIDGTVMAHDATFNHQLWFAATGGLLARTPSAQRRALCFLENIAAQVQLYPNGVIYHTSTMGAAVNYLKNGSAAFLKEIKSRTGKRKRRNLLYSKSAGYHAFNLYAFAMLKQSFPDAKIWDSSKFKTLVTAHRSDEFERDCRESEFGFRYNLSGIEIAYAVETFFADNDEAEEWVERQLNETYLDDSRPFAHDARDENTAVARTYEAARLLHTGNG